MAGVMVAKAERNNRMAHGNKYALTPSSFEQIGYHQQDTDLRGGIPRDYPSSELLSP